MIYFTSLFISVLSSFVGNARVKTFFTVSKQEMYGFITFSYCCGIKKSKRKKEIIKYLCAFIFISILLMLNIQHARPTFFLLV